MMLKSSGDDAMQVPIKGLFEAHLTVADLQRSTDFYVGKLGLSVASTFPQRRVTFLWVGKPGQSMLGIWEMGTSPQRMNLHVAFSVEIEHLLGAVEALHRAGVAPLDFFSKPTDEPDVLAWMPAAALYFRDPDDNLIEFISMLNCSPQPQLGIVPWSEWQSK